MLNITRTAACERWTINAPQRANGLGTALADALHQAAFAADQGIGPIVITAVPVEKPKGRIWVAGGDLIELSALTSPKQGRAYAEKMSSAFRQLHNLDRLVLTAIDGAAIGGGAELALVGDIRLATAASSLEFKQLQVGLATGYGSARRLIDLIGLAQAERLLYFSETLCASSALNLGLIHRLASDSAGLENLIENICSDLAGLSPEAVVAQKKMFRSAVTTSSDNARSIEINLFEKIWMNTRHAGFLKSFTGKTK